MRWEKRALRSEVWILVKVGDSIRSDVSSRSLRRGLLRVSRPDLVALGEGDADGVVGFGSGEEVDDVLGGGVRTPDSMRRSSSSSRGGRRYASQFLARRSLALEPSIFCRTSRVSSERRVADIASVGEIVLNTSVTAACT